MTRSHATSRKQTARDAAARTAEPRNLAPADSAVATAAVAVTTEPAGDNQTATDRDVASIRSYDWPQRPLANVQGFRDAGFQVVFRQSVLDEIHLHGQSVTDIEVCGVLIGSGYNDANGPYLLVEHCIRGIESRGQSTNVTFTAETWAHIQETMDRDFPDKKMVGWYHTHPGFGIFLSGMDQFICDNFFNLPWQVAFVYDPISGEEGDFVWRAGRTSREPILIPLITVTDATSSPEPAAVNPEKIIELLERVRRLEKRQKWMIIVLAFLAAFVAYFTPMSVPGVKPATMPAAGNPGQNLPPLPAAPVNPAARPAVPSAPLMIDPTTQPML
jgi:proteasome lid subunit RPN8/RPN11